MALMFFTPVLRTAAVLLLPASLAVAADSAENPLEQVLVTATRVDESLAATSRPVTVIDRSEIEQYKPRSIAEVLAYEPNVTIEGGPRAGSQTVNIRGLDQNKILQTIDGVRQKFESGHRPSYYLDPELLKSVEAIKGPTSALWGSGALGGVVAQNTISAADLVADGSDRGGFVKGAYNNNGEQRNLTTAWGVRSASVDLLVTGYVRNGNDIELGNGEDLQASEAQGSGTMIKLGWQASDDYQMIFNYRESDDKGQVPSNGTLAISATRNFVIERDSNNRNLSIANTYTPANDLIKAKGLLYWNRISMDETRVSDDRFDNTELNLFGFNLNNISVIDGITLLYGFDGYREEFVTRRGGSNRPEPLDARTDVWGVFFESEIPLSSAVNLELGARYDSFETSENVSRQSRDDSAVSPSAALVWQASDWMKWVLRYDEAFRAPSSEELYTSGAHFCFGPGVCNEFNANPDLEPEESTNYELRTTLLFSGLLAENDGLTLNASLFYNEVENFIEQVLVDDGGLVIGGFSFYGETTWLNVDEATVRGFELDADYRLENFSARLAYGRTRGEDDASGVPLFAMPADKWVLNLGYRFAPVAVTVGTRFTYTDAQTETPPSADNSLDRANIPERYDGYRLLDLFASWEPQSGMLQGLRVDLAVNNVTDRYYRIAFEELFQPGREVKASVRYRF